MKDTQRGFSAIYLALTLCYMGAIYWLSSLPGDQDPGHPALAVVIAWTPPALQNLLHIPVYGLLAWLWYHSLCTSTRSHAFCRVAVFILAAGYGVSDEWHQLHVPGRYASFTDILMNCAGVLLALWWIQHRRCRESLCESGDRPAR